MASAFLRAIPNAVLQRCSYASSVVALPALSEPAINLNTIESDKPQAEDVKITKLGNGVTVASLENHSVSSHISVLVKAGSRYDPFDKRGLNHLMRNCAYFSTTDKVAFTIAREIDFLGGNLRCTSTREHLLYSADFLRGNLDVVMDTLGSVLSSPCFYHWEVNDVKPKVELEIAAAQSEPTQIVLEALHHAAYRNTLSNPLYCPSYNLPRLTSEDLKSFHEKHFLGNRITVAGIGVNHDQLIRSAHGFSSIPASKDFTEEQAEYVGGSEMMIPSPSRLVHAVLACKGVSLKSGTNELVSAGVLQHVLGRLDPHIKWGNNTGARLNKAVANAVNTSAKVTAINLNYYDSGLFGMYAVSESESIGKVLKTIVRQFCDVAKGNISDEEVARAKNKLKASYLMTDESADVVVDDIGLQASFKGSFSPIAETIEAVDAVSKDDVVKTARSVFLTRPTFVAFGNLTHTPRLDQLSTEMSLK